jgi:hypothetical protein
VTAPPPAYGHVVWIVMESHAYDEIIGSSDAPSINELVTQHGLATDFHAESHPSLPNYIAMTSARPRACPTTTLNCGKYNVPLGDTPDVSARFTFVTPNLIRDMHDGTVSDGDTWLSTFVPKVLASDEYAAGRAALFITWDEDDLLGDNHIPTLVIAPSVEPGTQVTARLDHCALLRATQEMLGVTPLLGNAATAADMRTPFHLESGAGREGRNSRRAGQ